MLDLVVVGLIGAFIGWNIPQPWWARYIQEKVASFFKGE
jgi:uncharacterized membrane protein YeaQ/YmgE (transglycosylase-associated protein family)